MDIPQAYGEAATIGAKILGAVAAVLSFRWLVNIFKGPDRKLSQKELKELIALIFFVGAGGWMIWKEGTREDLSHEVFGAAWLSIVFGSLLVVLHLEGALDKILQIMQALIALRKGTVVTTIEEVSQENTVKTTKQVADPKVP